MKLAILSCEPNTYSTKRLKEASEKRGHIVKILNTLKFSIDLTQDKPTLYYKQKLLSEYDAVLPRIGSSITYYGKSVVRQFQEMDIFCGNSATAISYSRDKLRSLQLLSRYGIGIPKTAFVKEKKDILPAIERVGGAPVIIKLIEGTQGVGVLLAETVETATAMMELLQSQKQNVLIQKFVAESKGRDIRAIVVGDQVVAAMRRVAQGQEFRSNIHRGGIAEQVDLDESYKKTAIKSCQILGLRIAGVDLLEGHDGPQVLEVNSSPGLKGIETCTKLDVAGAIIDYIAAQVDFPEIDLRNRLNVSRGYGVSEVYVPEGSKFINKTLSDPIFSDVNVLTLEKENKIIPNPKKSRIIEAGDKLLCFGKLEIMRTMIPAKVRKMRRPDASDLDTNISTDNLESKL